MVGDFHIVAIGADSRHSPQILEMAFAESGLLGSLLFPADAFEPVPAKGSEQAVYSYHARSRLKDYAVMFFPNGNISLSIDLKQYVEDTKDETDGDKITYKEVEKLDTPLIIDQSKISKDVKEFKAGTSYNVYITIYGFEKIEVTAVLTAWEDGGDIETDIEDGK